MSAEVQGAIQTAEFLRANNIPASQFGYDGSMRASVQRAMDLFIGSDSLVMDYLGSAPDEEMPSKIGVASKLYANYVTFLWFLAADLLESGICREGHSWLEAFNQLSSRQWEWAGARKKMETKDDYKKRNANMSPDEADAVVGLVHLVYKRSGIFEAGRRTPQGSSVLDYVLQQVQRSGRSRYDLILAGEAQPSRLTEAATKTHRRHITWRR
jgi:hypothetical protein